MGGVVVAVYPAEDVGERPTGATPLLETPETATAEADEAARRGADPSRRRADPEGPLWPWRLDEARIQLDEARI